MAIEPEGAIDTVDTMWFPVKLEHVLVSGCGLAVQLRHRGRDRVAGNACLGTGEGGYQ